MSLNGLKDSEDPFENQNSYKNLWTGGQRELYDLKLIEDKLSDYLWEYG